MLGKSTIKTRFHGSSETSRHTVYPIKLHFKTTREKTTFRLLTLDSMYGLTRTVLRVVRWCNLQALLFVA